MLFSNPHTSPWKQGAARKLYTFWYIIQEASHFKVFSMYIQRCEYNKILMWFNCWLLWIHCWNEKKKILFFCSINIHSYILLCIYSLFLCACFHVIIDINEQWTLAMGLHVNIMAFAKNGPLEANQYCLSCSYEGWNWSTLYCVEKLNPNIGALVIKFNYW